MLLRDFIPVSVMPASWNASEIGGLFSGAPRYQARHVYAHVSYEGTWPWAMERGTRELPQPIWDWMSLLVTAVALNFCANPQALVMKNIFKQCKKSLLAKCGHVATGLMSCHVLAKLQ